MTNKTQNPEPVDIERTLLVSRNSFNRTKSERSAFEAHFGLLCELAADASLSPLDRGRFADEAISAIDIFSLNAELDAELTDHIFDAKQRISGISADVQMDLTTAAIAQNGSILAELQELAASLEGIAGEEELSALSAQIIELDASLDKAALTDEQSALIDSLSHAVHERISRKRLEFQRAKAVAYNLKAVENIAKAFKAFEEDKYSLSASLLSRTLFADDPARFSTETALYYQSVYQHIFNLQSDYGKKRLTELAITLEGKR